MMTMKILTDDTILVREVCCGHEEECVHVREVMERTHC